MRAQQGFTPQAVEEWIEDALDVPMVFLSVVFLALAIVDATVRLSPGWSRTVTLVQWGIWVIFTAEFIILLALAADKHRYLRRNWLSLISLVLPFLRVFRALRALRALRTLKLFRLFAITGRAWNQLSDSLQTRGAGYVLLTTVLVTLFGGAGMYLLEQGYPGTRFQSFGDGLWWSAASVTTVGSDLAPRTAEGRILAVIVFMYSTAVIGYIAAVLASYFIGKQVRPPQPDVSQTEREIADTVSQSAQTPEELQEKLDHLIGLLEKRAAQKRTRDA